MAPRKATYHVHREGVTELGGVKTEKDERGRAVIRMTVEEAQYWLDQGVIGTDPHNAAHDGGLMRKPAPAPGATAGPIPQAQPDADDVAQTGRRKR